MAPTDNPLHRSIVSGTLAETQKILEDGTWEDVNEALVTAIRNQNNDAAKLLIEEAEADIHTQNDAPLTWAAIRGNAKMAQHLLDLDHFPTNTLEEALYHATKAKSPETIQCFLTQGINPAINEHATLVCALNEKHKPSIQALLKGYSSKMLEEILKKPNILDPKGELKTLAQTELTRRRSKSAKKSTTTEPELEP